MKCYKFTDQNMRTYNGFQWELGVEHQTSGNGNLCSEGWLHCYSHSLLAVLLNPIHAKIENPRLFEVKALGKHKTDNELKEGFTKMTLIKELEIPAITVTQKIAFAILCSLEGYKEPTYMLWANNWLNAIDRTYTSAADAADAADAAADATDAAAYATDAAAFATDAAAYAAACAADADAAARAAARAADAADAAACAADAAARAAACAADAANINLVKMAKKALTYS